MAAAWGQGIFDQLQMTDVIPVLITLVVLAPALAVLAPGMRMFELGPDSARSKGVNTERLQMLRPHRPPNLDTFGSGLDQPHPHGAEPTFAFLVVEWASHVPLVTRCAAHANRRTGAAAELHRHGCSCEWDCC